ncbi:MAG: AMP-binding protein, partial [Candidatus Sericytochromatia bacterium]|nr:AMP-binding protein [Candidatus Tanganyikabacteria bacterium]
AGREAADLLGDSELPLLTGSEAGPTLSGGPPGPAGPAPVAARDLALIQFSSGSTGDPRGVCLSLFNLEENLEAIGAVMRPRPDDVGVAWLPLHHDMGLIGCLLFTQRCGIPLVLLSPEYFIRGPARWLRTMSDFGATMTSAPNFAYRLCAALPAAQVADLDLSRLRAALVGAEPVQPPVLRAFAARYAPAGFDPACFVPTYGLAEATLAVAMTPPGRGMQLDGDLPSVGPAIPGVAIEIRDEATGATLPEGQVGEIVVRAPSVTAGYVGDAAATAAALADGALRTGDLGYLRGGELFVSGRIKDLIIKGGQKYHPQDLEALAERHAAVRAGGVSAFLVPRAADREDRLVLVAEVLPQAATPDVAPEIRRHVQEVLGVRVDEVVLVVPQQLPRTTSGKLRRSEARDRFLAGRFVRADA